jgi:phototropin
MTDIATGTGTGTGTANSQHGFDFGNISPTPQNHTPERGVVSPTSQRADTPRKVISSGNGTTPIADFFSPEVFQIVLHNPATAHQLLKFSQARMCGENMEFLERVCLTEYPSNIALTMTCAA